VKETLEFRLHGEFVRRYLPEAERIARSLGNGFVYQVKLDADDPLVARIRSLDGEVRAAEGSGLFAGWDIRRKYSTQELGEAPLFRARLTNVFEPAGEECGTEYDDAAAFPDCGAGAPQVTPLHLSERRIPVNADFARTIAGEVVASRRARDLFAAAELEGPHFNPLLTAGKCSERHFQLEIGGPRVEVDEVTRAGGDPFDETARGRCAGGHVIGLSLLTEVTVKRASVPDQDIMATRQMVGIRQGLLRPQPILLLSPRAYRLVKENGLRGLLFEVAHLS
jgi:hypothetical protein